MKILLKLILFILISIRSPITIYGSTYGTYYFPNINSNENEKLIFMPYNIPDNISIEEKVYISLENILNNEKNMVNYIPSGLSLLNINFYKGNLILNFNENINNYGGSFFEIKFITQILSNCFQFSEIESVTFLTNGILQDLEEGSPMFYIKKEFEVYYN